MISAFQWRNLDRAGLLAKITGRVPFLLAEILGSRLLVYYSLLHKNYNVKN